MTTGRLPSVEGGIQPTIFDAAGDLLYAVSADTPARLGIGSTGNVLTVTGGVPTWAAPAGGAVSKYTLISTSTPSSTTTLNLTSLSGKNKYFLQCNNLQLSSAGTMLIRFNSDSGSNYSLVGSVTSSGGSVSRVNQDGTTGIFASSNLFNVPNGDYSTLVIYMDGCADTGQTFYTIIANGVESNTKLYAIYGVWSGSAAITSINITATQNFLNSSTFKLYGSVV